MQFNINKILFIGICITQLYSCNNKKENSNQINTFPFTEAEMIEMNDPGLLLEYAIYDTSKIDFVKNLICETLKQERDIVFRKSKVIINDNTYFHYIIEERMYVEFDYIGMIYFDANNLDTFSMYSCDWKYKTDNLDKAITEICENNKFSKRELIKHDKVSKFYIPKIYFHIEVNSMNCDCAFIEHVVHADRFIDSLLQAYVNKEFPDDKILVKPYTIIQLNM